MRKFLGAVALCAVLAGCATQQGSNQAERFNAEAQALSEQYYRGISEDRGIDPIRNKVAVNVSQTTFEMLANNNKPTADEREAILALVRRREPLVAQFDAIEVKYNHPFHRVFQAQRNAAAALLADLYNGAITYGELARKRQELDAQAKADMERIRTAHAAEAAAIEQASLQRMQNYLALQQTLNQQQAARVQPVIVQQPSTVRLQTTCQRIGQFTYCN